MRKALYYFFLLSSSWIANLGVVPLFLSAAFLLAPLFLSLPVLLFLVTLVLETMLYPYLYYKRLKGFVLQSTFVKFLAGKTHVVKAILLISCIFPVANAQKSVDTSIILAIGAHKEIQLPKFTKYSLGNKDVVRHKLGASKKSILLKGIKQGFSELLIWNATGGKTIFSIYVLSKIKLMKLAHLSQLITDIKLTPNIVGPILKVQGRIIELSQYQKLHNLIKNNKEAIDANVKISASLRNKVIGLIYKEFFKFQVSDIQCQFERIKLICRASDINNSGPNKDVLNHLKQTYFVTFINSLSQNIYKNFMVKLKLIQLEKTNGEELQIGLDHISTNLDNIFNMSLFNIMKKNKFLLSKEDIDVSTIAESESILKIDHPLSIQIGSEVPYTLSSYKDQRNSLEWKFAGIKIKLKIKNHAHKLLLEYATVFTKPSNGSQSSISGSKENSAAYIKLNQPLKLFEVKFKSRGKNIGSIPYLSKIPILGRIFQSSSNSENFKNITGILLIEEL
jgi:hypothetical protein